MRISNLTTSLKYVWYVALWYKNWRNELERILYIGYRKEWICILYTEPWQGMTSTWSAKEFVPRQGGGGQAACQECSPECVGSWLGLAAWACSGDPSPSIAGVAVTPQTSAPCSSAWERLRVLLKVCMNVVLKAITPVSGQSSLFNSS